jgi:hypothetical protein
MAWSTDEREAFLRNLSVLAETLGETVTTGRLVGYAVALEDVPAECIQIGLERAMRECKFFPKPVELRELGEQSPKWKRAQEARRQAIQECHQKALGPGLTDEQIQANIDKLKAVVKRLAFKRRMR